MKRRYVFVLFFLIVSSLAFLLVFSDEQRMKKIMNNISDKLYENLILIDKEYSGFGTPVSVDSSVYRIIDQTHVNCSLLHDYEKNDFIFYDYEKTYIDVNESYCSASLVDQQQRNIYIVIQKEIFIIKIFVD